MRHPRAIPCSSTASRTYSYTARFGNTRVSLRVKAGSAPRFPTFIAVNIGPIQASGSVVQCQDVLVCRCKTRGPIHPMLKLAAKPFETGDLLKRIRTSDNLPTLSAVAMEVLKLTRDDNVSLKDLACVIEKDPALTVKILRLVNSSFCGLPREVSSVQRAVIALGVRTTTLLTLGFSLGSAVGSRGGRSFDHGKYWKRSIIHAVTARLLAKAVLPRVGDQAFVAGLLADVGMVAAWQCVPETYGPVFNSSPGSGEALYRIEERMLGISHARIGQDLLEHWSLPETICRAVGAHHGEKLNDLRGESLELAKISFAAADVAGFLAGDPPHIEFQAVQDRLRSVLGISAVDAETVFGKLEEHVKETASLLSVKIDTTLGALIQTQATLRMAQVARQMEAECSDLARREAAAQNREGKLLEDQKEMIRVASTDFLTGLNNRAAFDRDLRTFLTREARTNGLAALLMLDVDHFKKINDTYGHPAGDVVLRGVGKVLSGAVRSTDVAARYGGEEFAVITSHENASGASILAERIRNAIAREVFVYNDQIISVTVSVGVAIWKSSRTVISEKAFVEAADKALYSAKREGRNQVQIVTI